MLASLPTSPRVRKSVYDCRQEGHHPRITRPKVLLVVGHPSIGAALEALLRIEDRYEVKRAQSLEQVASGLDGWVADLAIVDGVLVPKGRTEVLNMPTIVLSGNPQDGRRLASRFALGQGWLRKDATAEEIRAAIDRALASGPRRWPLLVVVAVLVLAVIVIAVLWYLMRLKG
jgi:AcrR family transcriptional regulator